MIAVSTSRPSALAIRVAVKHALVVGRHDLGELRAAPWPVGQHRGGHGAAGVPGVPGHHVAQPGQVLGFEALQFDHLGVHHRGVQSEHEGDAARHPGGHVAAGLAEHHDTAAGHVLAGVVADALGDGERAGVAGAEPLADPAAQEDLAGRGAVQQRVARDHVVLRQEQHVVGWPDDDAATRKSLADIVVGVTDQVEGDARRQERADRLAGRAGERDVDGVVRQPLRAVAAGDLRAQQGAHGSVDVAHRQFQPHRMGVFECALGELDQRAGPAPGPGRGPGPAAVGAGSGRAP